MKVEASWDKQEELPGQRREVGPPGTFEKLQVIRQVRGEMERGWQGLCALGNCRCQNETVLRAPCAWPQGNQVRVGDWGPYLSPQPQGGFPEGWPSL